VANNDELESAEMADGEAVTNRQCDDRFNLIMSICTEIKADGKDIKNSVGTMAKEFTEYKANFDNHVKQKESVWAKGGILVMGAIALLALIVSVVSMLR
jgi:hypothetical protein